MEDLSFLQNLDDPSALEAFAQVEVIYTDLDGTLLAPRGRLLSDFAGNPSTAVAQAIVALRRAGIELVIVTGRSRVQGNEFVRLLDPLAFIGEMGTVKQQRGASPIDIEYDTGTFAWDRQRYATPYEAIEASGARQALFERFPGKIEMNYPRCLDRDVTHALRGFVDVDEANAFFEDNGYELQIEDNGLFFSTPSTLIDCPEVHGYHIVPAHTSKALAVQRDMRERGLKPCQTVSIGDGPGDVEMGRHTGAFVLMENGRRHPRNAGLTREVGAATGRMPFMTRGRCCDGWVEFARRVLQAR